MNQELVSKKTRNAFREFLVDWVAREIKMAFEAGYVECDRDFVPQVSGQRRALVEKYYRTLDFKSEKDVLRLIAVYKYILNAAYRGLQSQSEEVAERSYVESLVATLEEDGFRYKDGKMEPITPEARRVLGEPLPKRTVSEVTRRNIFDYLRASGPSWWGRLSEEEFLSRLYDLDSLPSDDSRFKSAAEDICQHRVNNPNDWPDDWIFTDSRFDLLNCADEAFLCFLCEMLHPGVRPEAEEVRNLLTTFNRHLTADGWEIATRSHMSGRPIFAARLRMVEGAPVLGTAKPILDILNAEYVTRQITRMEGAITSDPELAIGTAKEFVETMCKTILSDLSDRSECGEHVSSNIKLPQLVGQVRAKLELLPESIPQEARGAETIKALLGNLGTVAQGLAELRGLYGSGHGKEAGVKGLQPRHARLAVGAACTLAVFLFETYQERKGNKE
jgi:hypothetical protein